MDSNLILVVRRLAQHGRQVAVVEVVEAVAGVAPAGPVVRQVAQSAGPQDLAAHVGPVAAQFGGRQRSVGRKERKSQDQQRDRVLRNQSQPRKECSNKQTIYFRKMNALA